MTKQPDAYLELAPRALERVPRFLAGRTMEAYLADDLCQWAVERQLEVAGDARSIPVTWVTDYLDGVLCNPGAQTGRG